MNMYVIFYSEDRLLFFFFFFVTSLRLRRVEKHQTRGLFFGFLCVLGIIPQRWLLMKNRYNILILCTKKIKQETRKYTRQKSQRAINVQSPESKSCLFLSRIS